MEEAGKGNGSRRSEEKHTNVRTTSIGSSTKNLGFINFLLNSELYLQDNTKWRALHLFIRTEEVQGPFRVNIFLHLGDNQDFPERSLGRAAKIAMRGGGALEGFWGEADGGGNWQSWTE